MQAGATLMYSHGVEIKMQIFAQVSINIENQSGTEAESRNGENVG